MTITILIGLFAVFFAYISKFIKYGLEIAWIIIFVFLAIRFDFGNDYNGYWNIYNNLTTVKLHNQVEPGWLLLNSFFFYFLGKNGFYVLVALLSLLNCTVYYVLIRKYVSPNYYWFAVFIYVFDSSLLLIQASMMRQNLAMNLLAWAFVIALGNRSKAMKMISVLSLILLSYSFHKSSLIGLIFLLLCFVRWDKIYIVLFSMAIVLFFMHEVVIGFLSDIIHSYFDSFDVYLSEGELSIGLGFLYKLAWTGLFLILNSYTTNKALYFLNNTVIVSFLVIPFQHFSSGMMGRILFYLSMFSVVVFPCFIQKFKEKYISLPMMALYVFFMLSDFVNFFNNDIWKDKFSEYHTILSIL